MCPNPAQNGFHRYSPRASSNVQSISSFSGEYPWYLVSKAHAWPSFSEKLPLRRPRSLIITPSSVFLLHGLCSPSLARFLSLCSCCANSLDSLCRSNSCKQSQEIKAGLSPGEVRPGKASEYWAGSQDGAGTCSSSSQTDL